MRLGFITCVEFGLNCLREIHAQDYHVDVVVTLEDGISTKKSGRVSLDTFCSENDILLIKTENINRKTIIDQLESRKLDWLFIIGWSQIACADILNVAKNGAIGAHPTLLPQGRGRAPIPWAIIKNLYKTGVSLFKIGDGVDDGPLLLQEEILIEKEETASTLYKKVNDSHVRLIRLVLPELFKKTYTLTEQNHSQATYWPRRGPEDGKINLSGSVYDAERLIRAVTRPYPGAFYLTDTSKVVVWEARIALETGLNQKILEFHDGNLVLTNFDIYER